MSLDRLLIGGIKPRSRIVLASGCRATNPETILLYSKMMQGVGVFTTKSIGPEPRAGNLSPIYCADPSHGSRARRNAVGLANPGHLYAAKELAWLRRESPNLNGAILLGSAFGATIEDFIAVCSFLAPYVDGFELNFSCPHAQGYGADTGRDADGVARVVDEVFKMSGKDVFAKLSPNLPDETIADIAKACVAAGARGISLINTVTPEAVCFEGTDTPILYNGVGGGSGPYIKERGLDCVRLVRNAVGAAPLIIGGGGIFESDDVHDYIDSGADLVSIGTSVEGMSSERLARYVQGLAMSAKHEPGYGTYVLLPPEPDLSYRKFVVKGITDHFPDLRVMRLGGDESIHSGPGQFVFLAVPAGECHPTMEAPFSVPCDDPLTLAVRIHPGNGRKDHFTSRVAELDVGDTVFVRGPYGVPFSVDEDDPHLLLVGGGTGVAALASVAGAYRNHAAFIGARTASDVLFQGMFNRGSVHVATDDGSGGHVEGTVVDLLAQHISRFAGRSSYVVTCGPAKMMQAVVGLARDAGFGDNSIYAIVEPHMKCGVGISGSCALGDGYIACTDGHILSADRFMRFVGEHKIKRDACGAWMR